MEPPSTLGPIEFLRGHPPFDRLGVEGLRRIDESLEVAFYPRGAQILRRGGPRSEHLYVVRKGVVQLARDGQVVMTLEEGDCLGFPSLLGRASPHADAVAAEETLLYRIPEEVFRRLVAESPRFAEFFLLDLAGRLRQTAAAELPGGGSDLAVPARQLAAREPLFVAPSAKVGDAARLMRASGASAVLVEGTPPGILTDRDLRSRVLAEGHGPETPVTAAMTRPAITLPAGASLFEALLFMLEHGVHHAPLEHEQRIVGMVTDTDLLRLHLRSPLHLVRELEGLRDTAALGGYAHELAAIVEALSWRGAEASQIGRIVSRLNDTLVARLLALAEAELGPPSCPYSWIVLGSEGRMEQMLITDQDNALVWGEDSPAARAYFPRLAERAVAGLLAASFPPCAGGFMATRWQGPLAEWKRRFARWIEAPEPQALLEASNFFDFRPVHGALALAVLDEALLRAGREGIFLAHLAKSALAFRPPLGAFHQLRAEHGGINLKAGGILPIVGLARLYSLAAGSRARPTLERLEAAAQAGTLSREGSATLTEAFRFLLRLRLRSQLAALRHPRGEAPGMEARGKAPRPEGLLVEPPGPQLPELRVEELPPLERRMLKETFLAIRELQEATALRYATGRLG
jgi:CBS domain-containing protein